MPRIFIFLIGVADLQLLHHITIKKDLGLMVAQALEREVLT